VATREELIGQAGERAHHNEMTYFGCTQAVLAALQDTLGGIAPSVFKAGSCLAGGVVRRGETCGALTGALLAIGCQAGRERLEDVSRLRASFVPGTEMYLRFQEAVGHTLCAEIHRRKFGRHYPLYDPAELKAFHEAGGHGPDGCPQVCAGAARIAADILLRLREDG
jgi:C_GCAxxG_C_C family probable redox protein